MTKIIPWLAYGASVYISHKFSSHYWVVGPVFAAAVLLANFEAIRKKISPSHLLFIGVSTLVYALVFWISDKGWKFSPDWLDMLAGSLSGGVVVGSLLLPFLHTILLGADAKTAQSTALVLIVSWYAVVLLSWIDDAIKFKPDVDYILIAIALWQGIYLTRLKVK